MNIVAADRTFCPAELRTDFFDSPFGRVLIAVEPESANIAWLSLVLDKSAKAKKANLAELEDHWQPKRLKKGVSEVMKKPGDWIFKSEADIGNLLMKGTAFQHSVWEKLLEIPTGETVSYADVALHLNRKKSHARAVGSAVAANTIAILVPCHRVVRSGGDLSGFRWGITRKRMLLDWEAASLNQAV